MCGIFAYSGNNVTYEQVSNSLKLLKHRGPDNSDYFIKEGSAIAHTRLSIQDTSENGNQPMFNSSHDIAIVYNGEIYNVLELRDEISQLGYVFRGYSDTEIILKLYEIHGRKFLEKLNGIYSIVIWDLRNQYFFIARDPFGVKPLYYSENNERFICSSEIKAISSEQSFDKQINYDALGLHLTYLWCPGPQTIFKKIYKLDPGTAIIVRNGKIKDKWTFYENKFEINEQLQNPNKIKVKLLELLKESVKKQLISDVPIGAFLSGGVDSSAIVSLVRCIEPDLDLKTFTISFDVSKHSHEGFNSDLPYAKYMAEKLGYELDVVNIDHSIISNIDDMIWHMDEPIADPAALNTMLISELARDRGIKVLLSGTGGDDIFAGYRRHTALNNEFLWQWMPRRIKNQISKSISKMPIYNPLLRRLKKIGEYIHLEENERICSYFNWMNPERLENLLSQYSNNNMSTLSVSHTLSQNLGKMNDEHKLNKMLYLEMKHFLTDHNLTYNDKMGMSKGVEIRVPFLDIELVKFANSLPVKFKKSGKFILKESLQDTLPKKILNRKKTGFGVPLRHWLSNDLREMVEDTLSKQSIQKSTKREKSSHKLFFNICC